MMNREELLKKCKRTWRDVPLPTGGSVRIQSLSERERSDYEAGVLDERGRIHKDGLREARRRLIALSVIDDKGVQLFDMNGDLEHIAELNAADADAIYSAAREHSGFDVDDVEESVKNSSDTPADG